MKYLFIVLLFCTGTIHAQTYTLEFAPVQNAYVGQPVTITAFGTSSTNNLFKLTLFSEYGTVLNPPGPAHCSGCDSLSNSAMYTAAYEGPVTFSATLDNTSFTTVKYIQFTINFQCPDEYCEPNPLFNNFAEWTRAKGYEECIISKYLEKTFNPDFIPGIKTFLSKRPLPTSQVMNIDFYDIVPTDSQATYLAMGAGEGGNCQYNSNFPDFCPSPIPADYLFLEQRFEETFGIDINFIYHRIDTSYVEAIGAPTLINGSYYRFPNTWQFLNQFPTRSIVHWAAQTWNNLGIGDMTGASSHAMECSMEPWNLYGVVTYTHEWGHTWGMPHSFILKNGKFVGFAIDGIMSNTYPIGSSMHLADCLDPLERYAMEPPGGFLDSATFVDEYNNAMLTFPGGLVPTCGSIDPAVLSAEIINETVSAYEIAVSVTNLGNIFAGYLKIALDHNGSNLETRVIPALNINDTTQLIFTISKSLLSGNTISFHLDPANEVQNENDLNNHLTFDIICGSPSNLSVSNVSYNSAEFSWTDANGIGDYELAYGHPGNTWLTVNLQGTNTHLLSNLQTGSNYNVKVRRVCNGSKSDWTPIAFFTTDCSIPQQLSASQITTTSANISWTDFNGTGVYTVEYRHGQGSWVSIHSIAGTNQIITNLATGTQYEVRVKRTCASSESVWSSGISFTTHCSLPQDLTTSQITASSANINWTDVNGAGVYTLEYREAQGNWITISGIAGTTQQLSNLLTGTQYEVRVKRICTDGESDWTSIISFMTDCSQPQDLTASKITTVTAEIAWTDANGVGEYTLEYRVGQGSWTAIPVIAATDKLLSGLQPGTQYEVRVKRVCANNESGWTTTISFTTECSQPNHLNVVQVTATTADIAWTDPDGPGEYTFEYRELQGSWISIPSILTNTVLITNLNPGTKYETRVKRICPAGESDWSPVMLFITDCSTPQNFVASDISTTSAKVSWNDPNGIGNYVLEYRIIGQTWMTVSVSGSDSYPLTNLQTGTTYETRVQRKCTDSESPWAVTSFSTTCGQPQNLVANNIASNSAQLAWTDPNGTGNYSVRYALLPGQFGTPVVVSGQTTLNIQTPQPGSWYQAEVKRNCSAGESAWTHLDFITLCNTPANFAASNVTSTTATVSWTDINGAGSYKVEYRLAGGSWGPSVVTNQTNALLPGLQPGSAYEARVKRMCTSSESAWSTIISFNTSCDAPQITPVTNIALSSATLNWTDPNGTGNYNIRYRKIANAGDPVFAWTTTTANNVLFKNISGLQNGTAHEYQVQRSCAQSLSPYTALASFTTLCPVPTNLTNTLVNYYSASWSWTSPGAAFTSFIFEYREVGAASWISKAVQGTSTSVSVLPNKSYEARGKTACEDNNSAYSNTSTVSTPNYCASSTLSSSADWIDLVKLETLNNPSSNNGGVGYKDYTNLSAPVLQAGESHTLQFSAGQTSQLFRDHTFRAWIDFNRDGDFTDANELIVFTTTSSLSTISMGFTVPSGAAMGVTRMRVSMAYNALPNPCSNSLSNGEVEDYLVNISFRISFPFGRQGAEDYLTEQNHESNLAEVFPNPVRTVLSIRQREHDPIIKLSVVDITGKVIHESGFQSEIAVRDWPAGMYLLSAQSINGIQLFKVMKE